MHCFIEDVFFNLTHTATFHSQGSSS